jgi:ribosomal protein S12 methylthiotransferase accessory factor
LILPGGKSAEYMDTDGIDWVIGKDIISGKTCYVPINSVVHPHDGKKLFRSNTNGLASGNSEEEAVFHAMLEVIERDAWSISELSKNTYRKVNVENAKNPLIFELLEKFKKAKINIILKDLTSEVGIPTVAAISDDDVLKDPALLCMGVGCHLHPEIAVLRALTEVAQSRATQIHGAREDTNRGDVVRKISYDRMKRAHKKWYTFKNEINIEDMPNNAKLNLKKDIETVKEILKQNGFDKIITVKLNKTDIDVSRVIIPKMEMYSVDRDRISLWIKDRIRRNLESNLNLI